MAEEVFLAQALSVIGLAGFDLASRMLVSLLLFGLLGGSGLGRMWEWDLSRSIAV